MCKLCAFSTHNALSVLLLGEKQIRQKLESVRNRSNPLSNDSGTIAPRRS